MADEPGHGHGHDTEPAAAGGHDKHAGHTPEMFRDRLWISLILTVPILYFSSQIQDWFDFEAVSFAGDDWVSPVLATILFIYAGTVFLEGGIRELKHRIPGMMTLISLAITVAYGYSLAVSLGVTGDPFYWELATLLDVMLLGHWIEMRSVQGASRALEHLAAMVPQVAHRVTADGSIEDVALGEIARGDAVLIRPGEQVPIDGRVVDGASSVNEAFLTGESRPVAKAAGDEVVGGAVNGEGALTITVIRTGGDTTLSQIMRLVEEAQASRSRFQVLADQAAFWLTIVAVATPTLLGWLVLSPRGATFAVARAVTVLVIACPHALGLAIPLVNMNATAVSARTGILVRSREAFERARNVRLVAFDKTGTLTEGRFVVSAVTTHRVTEEEALSLAAAVERGSEHPLAAAIVEAARDREVPLPSASEVRAVPGRGLQGRVGGAMVRVGRPEWALEAEAGPPPAALQRGLEVADERGESAVVLSRDGRMLAVLALADKVRDSAHHAVARLRSMGITPVMITGDAAAVARTVAADLELERFHARVLPQDKARIVEGLKAEGATAFVGDGINDAPALLEADLGIAIGAGTNVAIESADLVLVENDPENVARTLALSRATRRKMMQNLAWATGYNAVALPLAAGVATTAGVLLSPALGAVFMSLSTVIVALNAMLLRRVDLA